MMDAAQCLACRNYWAFAQTADRSSVITKVCPTCIATFPTLNWSLTR